VPPPVLEGENTVPERPPVHSQGGALRDRRTASPAPPAHQAWRTGQGRSAGAHGFSDAGKPGPAARTQRWIVSGDESLTGHAGGRKERAQQCIPGLGPEELQSW
jgi:hypothetical protein